MMRVKLFITLFLITTLLSLFLTIQAYGSAACCVNNGGEYACDYSNGTLYCRDGSISKDCSCRILTTPTPTFLPTPIKKPTPTIPKCVANSTYENSSGTCKCNSGYVVYENSCISYAQYCWKNFGGNSIYTKEKNACMCESGYSWDSSGTSCITYNKICQNELGEKSYYNSENNTCNCFQNYYIQDNKCQLIPTRIVSESQKTTKTLPSPTIVREPTVAIRQISTPTPTSDLNMKDATIVVNDDENINYITEEKNENIFKKIVSLVWSFFSNFL